MNLEVLLSKQFENAVLEKCFLAGDFSTEPDMNHTAVVGFLDGFHTDDVYVLKQNDDYLFGIRANTFVVEIGWHEYFGKFDEQTTCFLVSANHKGSRVQKLYVEKGGK